MLILAKNEKMGVTECIRERERERIDTFASSSQLLKPTVGLILLGSPAFDS